MTPPPKLKLYDPPLDYGDDDAESDDCDIERASVLNLIAVCLVCAVALYAAVLSFAAAW